MIKARCRYDSSKTCVCPEGVLADWSCCHRLCCRPPTKEPLPPQERNAPWWIEVLVWAVVVLAGLAALRRLLS